jgi:hypothetical protein
MPERPVDAPQKCRLVYLLSMGKLISFLVAQKIGTSCNDLSLFRIAQNMAIS